LFREARVPDAALLPHWARVAFAARCARLVFPLFGRSWPRVTARRSQAVLRAIEVAEQSAATANPADGLEEAVSEATITAGAALRSVYGFGSDEGAPTERDQATIATFVANAAGRSAKTAGEPAASSIAPALDAVEFAQTAAKTAAALTILVDMEHDFARLRRAVVTGRWNDQTAVPTTVFEGS
jgi:hypothetical protein